MTYPDLLTWAKDQPDARLSDADLVAMYQWLIGDNGLYCKTVAERLLIDLLRERAAK